MSDSNFIQLNELKDTGGPNWTSILTGVHYEKHQVTDNSFQNNRLEYYPNFFNYLESTMDNFDSYSITNWIPINQNVLINDVDYANLEYLDDSLVYEISRQKIINFETANPSSIFIHFDELDAPHEFGFSNEVFEYRETLNQIDTYISGLYSL